MGDLYLNIVESKNRDTGGFERQSVILFAEDLQEFLQGFDDSLRVLEKAFRERKRSGARRDRSGEDPGEGRPRRETGNRENYGRENSGDRGRYGESRGGPESRGNFRHDRGGEYHGDRDSKYGGDRGPARDIPARKPRRMAVKKTAPREEDPGRESTERREDDPADY
jgi:hypothetical protein